MVVPDHGSQGEETLDHPDDHALRGASPVLFEYQLPEAAAPSR